MFDTSLQLFSPRPVLDAIGMTRPIDRSKGDLCGSCRMSKCFAIGMQVELLRHGQTTTTTRTSKRRGRKTKIQLVDERATMMMKQWLLLMDLHRNYREVQQRMAVGTFIQQQNDLPVKMRFKVLPVKHFLDTNIEVASEYLFMSDPHLFMVSANDRSMLVWRTLPYIKTLTIWWLILFDDLATSPSISSVLCDDLW